MRLLVLGSAAGGGLPQWNCRCPVCSLAWAGDPRVTPRSQSGLAVSADGERWLLVNASPDLRQQILANPALWPRDGRRHSPIEAVILTNAEIDHVLGLLSLRERQPFVLHATQATHAALAANPMFSAGLERIGFAAQHIFDGSASRVLAHATSGAALQQNLVAVLEGK